MAECEPSQERDFNDYFYELDDIEQATHSIDSVEEELSKTPDGKNCYLCICVSFLNCTVSFGCF